MSSRSGVATLRTAIHLLLTYCYLLSSCDLNEVELFDLQRRILPAHLDLAIPGRPSQNIERRDSSISGDRWLLFFLLSMSLPCLVDFRQMSYAKSFVFL